MDGGAWWAAVHGVAESWTRLSDFTFHLHALGKEMATHSSVLAWRVPGTGSLVGCCLWGRAELDTTERLSSSSSVPLYVCVYVCVCVNIYITFSLSMHLLMDT